jgi:hypothetical protein
VVVDRRDDLVTRNRDLRPYVACRAHGAMRFLDRVQGGLDDIEGAVAAGQYEVAALQARAVVLASLSIQSLAHGGELAFDSDDVAFDFFGGVSPEDTAAALALANEATQLTERTAADWLDRFRAYTTDTERVLGYDNPLPVLRSPEGSFGLVGLMRRWSTLLEELGLPPLLRSDWIPPDASGH